MPLSCCSPCSASLPFVVAANDTEFINKFHSSIRIKKNPTRHSECDKEKNISSFTRYLCPEITMMTVLFIHAYTPYITSSSLNARICWTNGWCNGLLNLDIVTDAVVNLRFGLQIGDVDDWTLHFSFSNALKFCVTWRPSWGLAMAFAIDDDDLLSIFGSRVRMSDLDK